MLSRSQQRATACMRQKRRHSNNDALRQRRQAADRRACTLARTACNALQCSSQAENAPCVVGKQRQWGRGRVLSASLRCSRKGQHDNVELNKGAGGTHTDQGRRACRLTCSRLCGSLRCRMLASRRPMLGCTAVRCCSSTGVQSRHMSSPAVSPASTPRCRARTSCGSSRDRQQRSVSVVFCLLICYAACKPCMSVKQQKCSCNLLISPAINTHGALQTHNLDLQQALASWPLTLLHSTSCSCTSSLQARKACRCTACL